MISESPQDRLGFFGDDCEQHTGRPIRPPAALLPGMQRRHIESECAREGSLGEPEPVAELSYVNAFGNCDCVARQVQLATRMCECILEPRDKTAPQSASPRLRSPR
jgi:hypothetical protein